jgi:hypothetical protein
MENHAPVISDYQGMLGFSVLPLFYKTFAKHGDTARSYCDVVANVINYRSVIQWLVNTAVNNNDVTTLHRLKQYKSFWPHAPLCRAVERAVHTKEYAVLEWLLDNEPYTEYSGVLSESTIRGVIDNNDLHILKCLITASLKKISQKEILKAFPLEGAMHCALSHKNVEILQILLDFAQKCRGKRLFSFTTDMYSMFKGLMIRAVLTGSVEIVGLLIDAGIPLSDTKMNELVHGVLARDLEMVKLLVEKAKHRITPTAVSYAAAQRDWDILIYFAGITTRDRGVAVARVAQDGDLEGVNRLLRLGYSYDMYGVTYKHAEKSGNQALIRRLEELGCPNKSSWYTPLISFLLYDII